MMKMTIGSLGFAAPPQNQDANWTRPEVRERYEMVLNNYFGYNHIRVVGFVYDPQVRGVALIAVEYKGTRWATLVDGFEILDDGILYEDFLQTPGMTLIESSPPQS